MQVLAEGSLVLQLTATRDAKTREGSVERIDKLVHVQDALGRRITRTIRQVPSPPHTPAPLLLAHTHTHRHTLTRSHTHHNEDDDGHTVLLTRHAWLDAAL
jgi:hypothetical protein